MNDSTMTKAFKTRRISPTCEDEGIKKVFTFNDVNE